MRTLGEALTADERLAVIAAARALLGVRWGHQGRGLRLDCVGLVAAALSAVRALPASPTDYGRLPHNGTLQRHLCAWLGDPVDRDPEPGDVVTWRLVGEVHHVGIVGDHLDRGISLIHCAATAAGGEGRVIEHGIDARERSRIVQVFAP